MKRGVIVYVKEKVRTSDAKSHILISLWCHVYLWPIIANNELNSLVETWNFCDVLGA